MYSLNMPVSALRTKVRQEFERHRYVNQLPTVDVLIFKSHSEYQVRIMQRIEACPCYFATWSCLLKRSKS